MKSLALRDWTMEIVNQKPVLILRAKGVARGSIEIDEITSMNLIDLDTGELEIKTAGSILGGVPIPYTTRNVEEWPALDPQVFRMFGIDPLWLPEDHKFQSWHPEQARALNAPASLPAAVQKRVEQWNGEPAKKKVFSKFLSQSAEAITDWINEHELAEDVVSICLPPFGGGVVFYRAYEEIA